jgi:hypothetical protein
MFVIMFIFIMIMFVVVPGMTVLVLSFRGRGRPRHILLGPVLFPRKIFFPIDPNIHLSG